MKKKFLNIRFRTPDPSLQSSGGVLRIFQKTKKVFLLPRLSESPPGKSLGFFDFCGFFLNFYINDSTQLWTSFWP